MVQLVSEPATRRTRIARGIALATVVISIMETHTRLGGGLPLPALVGLVAVLCCRDGEVPELGLRLVPDQGWRYWFRLAIRFGLMIAVVLSVWAVLSLVQTKPYDERIYYSTEPRFLNLVHMCVMAPVAEEVIFRALLTMAVLPTLGPRGTIALSGLVFAAIHVLGGNASPENQIAGFLLAWTFLKSRTILVPIAMHAGGNCFALAGQVACWYFFPQP